MGGIPGSRLRRVVQTGLGILEKAAAKDQKKASEAGMDKNTPYEQRLTKTAKERNRECTYAINQSINQSINQILAASLIHTTNSNHH